MAVIRRGLPESDCAIRRPTDGDETTEAPRHRERREPFRPPCLCASVVRFPKVIPALRFRAEFNVPVARADVGGAGLQYFGEGLAHLAHRVRFE